MISRLSQIYNFSSLDSRRVWMFAKSDLANLLFLPIHSTCPEGAHRTTGHDAGVRAVSRLVA